MKEILRTGLLSSLFIVSVIFSACSQKEQTQEGNRLHNESSPYLLQHANNPVDWYPWGEEALEKAKRENKPIIISIGYAACHWCHVMEHESFEDEQVAKLMNEHFVSIKVDREERPDIDQIYVDVAQIMTGRAGWPLNVITFPDSRPFFAGTYFPKDSWMKILNRTIETLEEEPEKLEKIADQVTRGVQSVSSVINVDEDLEFNTSQVERSLAPWKSSFDLKFGGYQRTQKFPMPGSLKALLDVQQITGDMEILGWLELTLDKVSKGGIYDHLAGGFARYSVDPEWKVPHFEKMLYDNAQLISIYSQGYQVTGNDRFRYVVEETIRFLQENMRDKDGGYFSSFDADSEGEEGTYYVWTYEELQGALGEDFDQFRTQFDIKSAGNWESGKNVLYFKEETVIDNSLLELSKYKLLNIRNKRVPPALDTKVLTSWNALLIQGYLDAYSALGDESYRKEAVRLGSFILKDMMKEDGGLFRSSLNGKASINAFLDDYANVISAFLSLYSITFDDRWLESATKLLGYVNEHFSDDNNRYYFYTSDLDDRLLTRKQEMADNVIASSNSVMAKNLYLLGHYYFKQDMISRSRSMLKGVIPDLMQYGSYYYNWFSLLTMINYPFYEVAIVGDDAEALALSMRKTYKPNVIYLGGQEEGKMELLQNKLVEGNTYIYVCREKACKLPVNDPKLALDQITFTE